MHSSGDSQTFETGAVRDAAAEKPRPDLISPFSLWRLGEWLRLGAKRYTERNWEKGIPISRCIASIFRHLLQYVMGDTTEDHMAAVMCNAMFILHYEEMIDRGVLPRSLADLPSYQIAVSIPSVWDLPAVMSGGAPEPPRPEESKTFVKVYDMRSK